MTFMSVEQNQPGLLYLNLGNGKTALSMQKSFDKDAFYEDTTAAFFDANGDGNLDLMVGSGGNAFPPDPTIKSKFPSPLASKKAAVVSS